MAEPVSSTTLTGGAAVAAATGWWAGLDSGVVIGAFAGAVFFVISSTELTLKARAGYFFVSFIFGVLCAPYAAKLIALLIPVSVDKSGAMMEAPVALGALVAAAIAIKVLLALSTANMTGKLVSGIGNILAAAVVRQKDTGKDD